MVLYFVENVGAKCTCITLYCRQNGSLDQPFPNTFSKNESDVYVQKAAFLSKFEHFVEKFQSVANL